MEQVSDTIPTSKITQETQKDPQKGSQSEGVTPLTNRNKHRPGELIIRTKSEDEMGGSKDSKKENSKTVTITDVGVYEGTCASNSIPHGKGKLKLKNGDFYEGEFENGAFCGEGRMVTTDGCEYVGQWKANSRHGKGKESWTNGNSFSGEFEQDKKHGYGRKNFIRSIPVG